MNIAIIPWSKDALQNKMFEDGKAGEAPYTRVRQAEKSYFEKRKHRYETIDQYQNPDEIDWIIVYCGDLRRSYMKQFLGTGYENKLIYRANEPASVCPSHEKRRIRKLLKFYKYIVTWNPELVDGKRIFKVNIPYIMKPDFGDLGFYGRKLLTAIYSNKSSRVENELYSTRKEVFRYFEDYPELFDLYGFGWDAKEFKNYKGTVNGKDEVYHSYRFAIAFENEKSMSNGVTEKIFDCINAGIVPVYYGADDICEYVPENVFVDYRKFNSVAELHHFLEGMEETAWNAYIEAGRRYLDSGYIDRIGIKPYCSCIEKIMQKDPAKDIRSGCRLWKRMQFSVITYHDILVALGLRRIVRALVRKVKR